MPSTAGSSKNTASSGRDRGSRLSDREFAELFKVSFRVLWTIAVGITRSRTLAEDVVQEAAIVGLSKLDEFERGSNYSAWMGRTVRYLALNMVRKERKRSGVDFDSSELERSTAIDERSANRVELRVDRTGGIAADQPHFDDEVIQALHSVSQTARTCLLLRTIEGLEYSEISAALGIPPGTAMSHVHRARHAMRAMLTGRGR